MKIITSLAAMLVILVCCSSYENYNLNLEEQFKSFVVKYNKTYVEDLTEYSKRKVIFRQSLLRQARLNQKEEELGGTARYGINQFSDWTPLEFKGFLKRGSSKKPHHNLKSNDITICKFPKYKQLPQYWDWNKEGKVTAVKNQGKCGGCWAFSATELIETQWAIAGHKLEALSVQELISCSKRDGCSGGKTCDAMDWLIKHNYTLVTDAEYPYVGESTACKSSVMYEKGARIKSRCCFGKLDEVKEMKPIIQQYGPMAVNVDALLWHDYIDGIIQHHCTDTDINHAVQITGFDETGEIPFWIVRNSWGTQFGKKGYLYIKMGDNLCGLAETPSYVVV